MPECHGFLRQTDACLPRTSATRCRIPPCGQAHAPACNPAVPRWSRSAYGCPFALPPVRRCRSGHSCLAADGPELRIRKAGPGRAQRRKFLRRTRSMGNGP